MKYYKDIFEYGRVFVLLLMFSCNTHEIDNVKPTSISLNREAHSLTVGEHIQLIAVVNPKELEATPITWSCEDINIASVDETGLVTALSEGVVKIYAEALSVHNYCNITITKQNAPVTDIILNETGIILDKDEMFKLTATVVPSNATDQKVIWSSSDPEAVSVDEDGNVTALKEGVSVTITAAAGEKVATCVVYVNEEDRDYNVASYDLSEDGKRLEKWKGPEEHINMNIDSKLREVQTIAWGAFANNASMISLIVGDKVKEMEDYAFAGNTKLATVTLPNGIQTLGLACFNASPLLASINLPGTLTTIKNSAFAGTKLTSVEIPNSVTSFGNGVFNGCTELTSAILPNSMEAISNSTFFKCTKLVNVKLGNNVTSIGIYAFANCTALRKIDLPTATPPTVDPETFTSTPLSLVTLEVPVGSKSLYQAATIWSSFGIISEK